MSKMSLAVRSQTQGKVISPMGVFKMYYSTQCIDVIAFQNVYAWPKKGAFPDRKLLVITRGYGSIFTHIYLIISHYITIEFYELMKSPCLLKSHSKFPGLGIPKHCWGCFSWAVNGANLATLAPWSAWAKMVVGGMDEPTHKSKGTHRKSRHREFLMKYPLVN